MNKTNMLSQNASRNTAHEEKIRDFAKQFEQINIKSRDALHLACAEVAGCDYVLTCDDKFLKKNRQLEIAVKAMGPVEFINIWEHQNGY